MFFIRTSTVLRLTIGTGGTNRLPERQYFTETRRYWVGGLGSVDSRYLSHLDVLPRNSPCDSLQPTSWRPLVPVSLFGRLPLRYSLPPVFVRLNRRLFGSTRRRLTFRSVTSYWWYITSLSLSQRSRDRCTRLLLLFDCCTSPLTQVQSCVRVGGDGPPRPYPVLLVFLLVRRVDINSFYE